MGKFCASKGPPELPWWLGAGAMECGLKVQPVSEQFASSMVHCSALPCKAMQCNGMQCHVRPCPCDALPHDPMQCTALSCPAPALALPLSPTTPPPS